MRKLEHWDIFCRVVDNFGDAGVCWRLARKLARECGFHVRLWIDDLRILRKLEPALTDTAQQSVDRVVVLEWDEAADREGLAEADVVIEAFGCGLPDRYIEAMARSQMRTLWIVLEYLSAEAWVLEHHGLPSPHPRLSLERYFFFPGFVAGTGGLLRERDLFQRRDRFDEAQRVAFWDSLGHRSPAPDALVVSLFAYDSAPIGDLLEHWQRSSRPIVAVIPETALAAVAMRHLGHEDIPEERVLRRGALEVRLVPFVPQARYDELLWSCDVNFVRGEDSFVRAQWAARPLVWQIYPQEEGAHARKLAAFLDVYGEGLNSDAACAARDLMDAWNRLSGLTVTPGEAWDAFAIHLDVLRIHSRSWAERIAAPGDLAENLASFCRAKLK
jgi:uncharacterized repeat protein (TIGR03837 family)